MIFVDTGAWVAMADKSDQYHERALELYAALKQQKARFITSDYVIDETVTRIRYELGHANAVRFLESVHEGQRNNSLKIIPIENELFQEAETIFRRYDSVSFSFTDCTSFAVCRKQRITEVFAFDQHFTMMGIALFAK